MKSTSHFVWRNHLGFFLAQLFPQVHAVGHTPELLEAVVARGIGVAVLRGASASESVSCEKEANKSKQKQNKSNR